MGRAFGGELALHEQEFVGFPFAKVFVFPTLEIEFGAMAFADTTDGEMRMKFALFLAAGGVLDGGLQLFEFIDLAGEAYPDDARTAGRWKGAQAVSAQAEREYGRRTRGQAVRAPIHDGGEARLELLNLRRRDVAQELQGEMDLFFGRPAHGFAGGAREFFLAAHDVADDVIGYGHGNEGSH